MVSETDNKLKLEESWKSLLKDEFDKDYIKDLKSFLTTQYQKRKTIYPKGSEFFAAFNQTPAPQVKVVILGQDPYHGPNQAHGLAFSVRAGVKTPPSLENIYKELASDVGFRRPQHGYLKEWAERGVLLLNATLSVEKGRAGSHQNKGWERLTDKAVSQLNDNYKDIVFLLWGSYAQKKGQIIDRSKHHVLAAPHPSPLSAHRGFLGCKHFSKANAYLSSRGLPPVDWQLSEAIEA